MRKTGFLVLVVSIPLLAGCVAADAPYELEPIPGSLVHDGQPRTKLTKSPVGSTFPHRFRGPYGETYQETYQVAPDRSLRLVNRQRLDRLQGL